MLQDDISTQELLHKLCDKSAYNQILQPLVDWEQLGNHIDLDCWMGMYFEAMLKSNGVKKKRFPVENEVGKWFEASSYDRPVACANVDYRAKTTQSLTKV